MKKFSLLFPKPTVVLPHGGLGVALLTWFLRQQLESTMHRRSTFSSARCTVGHPSLLRKTHASNVKSNLQAYICAVSDKSQLVYFWKLYPYAKFDTTYRLLTFQVANF